MIEWLEKYLNSQNITLLMITHDRYFLDRVCNHILELEDEDIITRETTLIFYELKLILIQNFLKPVGL